MLLRNQFQLPLEITMDRVMLSEPTGHPHFIGSWQIGSTTITNDLIKYFYSNEEHHLSGITSGGVDTSRKNSIDLHVNPVSITGDISPAIQTFFNALNSCYQDYIQQWPFVERLGELDVGPFNIQKYESGGHFQRLHSERTTLSTSHRVLAWMTYLNTLQDEGETVFEYFGIRVPPTEGVTLIWPAEWTHAHFGDVVTTTKYIATGWFHFPPT